MNPDDDLLLYWSNELEPEKRAAVEARLRDDPEAAAYLQELQGLAQAVEALPRHQAPPSLTRRTIVELERSPDAPADGKLVPLPQKSWFTHWMAIAAGFIAAALLVFLYAVPRSSSPSMAEQTPQTPVPTVADTPSAPSPALSPPSMMEDASAPRRSRVASRLFPKGSRFSSNGRFRAARERLKKLRSQLPNHSSPNEKA